MYAYLCHLDFLPFGAWNLSSQTRIEPESPVLQGVSLNTGPPGQSPKTAFGLKIATLTFLSSPAWQSVLQSPELPAFKIT